MNQQHELFRVPPGVTTHWASFENPSGLKGEATRGNDGRKRSAARWINGGETMVLAESKGKPGMIRRIWIVGDKDASAEFLRGMRLDFYWDDAKTPAVSVPLGDFFCQSLGKYYPFSNALFANPEGRSHLCWIPMPFRNAMRITLTNENKADVVKLLFYQIDYTLGDELGDDVHYFHAHWRRENPTTLGKDYEFLPIVHGRGRFLGVNFGVAVNTKTYFMNWWGEGEVKIYLDGDGQYPTLCGTGTEDYIGTAWAQRSFSLPHSGCPYADLDNLQFGFYRLHIPDPVYFAREIRATIQQLGMNGAGYLGGPPFRFRDSMAQMLASGIKLKHGDKFLDMEKIVAEDEWTLYERHDDWSSCAYFYLDRAENGLPPLADVEARLAPARQG